MKNYLKTVIAYSKKVSTTGAMFETSALVVKEMSRNVLPDQAQTIVELGAGHGNITEVILERMNPNSKLFAFELHTDFCTELSNRISDKRLTLINDSAGNLVQYLQKHQINEVDVIISALPLVLFPPELVAAIFQQVAQSLKPNGLFIQVSYSLVMKKQLKKAFSNVKHKMVLLNMPPAFVFSCQKNA